MPDGGSVPRQPTPSTRRGADAQLMHVSHYFEWEDYITGGHAQSVHNQRAIMDERGIEYTTELTRDANILHLNNMGPRSLAAARRARGTDTTVIIHAHQTAADFRNSFAFSNYLAPPMKHYLRYAYSLADHILCPSEFTRGELRDVYGIDAPITVISNGFDPTKLDGADDPALRDEYHDRYDLSPPVVFTVGHVLRRKGVEAFIRMAREFPDVDFAWFGYLNPTGGGLLDRALADSEVHQLVKHAPENCTFTGYIDDICGAYAAGDIFFFPTRSENEGMALLEAMACGKPPVIRDLPVFDWLTDGTHCLKAAGDFTDPLGTLIDDAEERDRIGTNAVEKSQDRTLSTVGETLEEVYSLTAGSTAH